MLELMSVARRAAHRHDLEIVSQAGLAAEAKLQAAKVTATSTTTVGDPDARDLVDRLWPAIRAVECLLPLSELVSTDEVTFIIERNTT